MDRNDISAWLKVAAGVAAMVALVLGEFWLMDALYHGRITLGQSAIGGAVAAAALLAGSAALRGPK